MAKASITPPADRPSNAAVATSRTKPKTRLANVPSPVIRAPERRAFFGEEVIPSRG